jgi:hypothetical protein
VKDGSGILFPTQCLDLAPPFESLRVKKTCGFAEKDTVDSLTPHLYGFGLVQ